MVLKGRHTRKNKSKKGRSVKKEVFVKDFVKTMLEIVHSTKLFHWGTSSYAAHIASDGLHGKLSAHMDNFVEIALGKFDIELNMKDYKTLTIDTHADYKVTGEKFIEELYHYMGLLDEEEDTDLLNILDEILADMNKFLYL